MMDELDFLFGCVISLFLILLAAVVIGSHQVEEYKQAFTAECVAKGGVPQFNYRSTDLCLPTGTVIPMGVRQ